MTDRAASPENVDSLERWALRVMLVSLVVWPLAIVGLILGARLLAVGSISWGVWTLLISLAEVAVAALIILG